MVKTSLMDFSSQYLIHMFNALQRHNPLILNLFVPCSSSKELLIETQVKEKNQKMITMGSVKLLLEEIT